MQRGFSWQYSMPSHICLKKPPSKWGLKVASVHEEVEQLALGGKLEHHHNGGGVLPAPGAQHVLEAVVHPDDVVVPQRFEHVNLFAQLIHVKRLGICGEDFDGHIAAIRAVTSQLHL